MREWMNGWGDAREGERREAVCLARVGVLHKAICMYM